MDNCNCTGHVSHCACSRHCKTSCPYFTAELSGSSTIRAHCALFDHMLLTDSHYMQFCMVLFCRSRECRVRFDAPPERAECRAVN